MRPSRSLLLVVLLVGVLAISGASLLVRWCSLGGLAIATWRLLFAFLLVLPRVRSWHSPPRRDVALRGAAAGICLAVHFATWISSLSYLPVAVSVVLVTTSPIFTALLAHLFLGEQLGRLQTVGMLLAACGAAGMTPISGFGGAGSAYGCGLSLSGALAIAGYFVLAKGCREWDWGSSLIWIYGWSAAALVVACLLRGVSLGGYSQRDWLLLVGMGLIPQVIGHGALNWAMRHAGTAQVSVTVLGEPIGASALAWIFLGEPVGLREGLFACLILSGVACTLWPESSEGGRQRREEHESDSRD